MTLFDSFDGGSMRMAMFNIRKMRVFVGSRAMLMLVGASGFLMPLKIVKMPVINVVHMLMVVILLLVPVLMLVVFCYVQPHAQAHQGCSQPKAHRGRFT